MGENAQGFLLRCTWGLCSMGSPLASCLPYQTIHSRLLYHTIPRHPYTGMHMETVTYMGRFLALRQQHPPEDVLCPRLHPLWCSTSVSNQTLPYSLPYNVQWPYQTASSRNQPIPYRITQAKPCYTISDDNNDDNDGDDDDDDDDDVDDDDDDGRARLNWLPPQRECRCWMVIGYRSRSPSITLIIITLQSTVYLLLNNCIKLIISLLHCICITTTTTTTTPRVQPDIRPSMEISMGHGIFHGNSQRDFEWQIMSHYHNYFQQQKYLDSFGKSWTSQAVTTWHHSAALVGEESSSKAVCDIQRDFYQDGCLCGLL